MVQYQVVGACVANVPVDTPQGSQLAMFHQHALLPPGVPADRIAHLLSVGLIKEVGGSGTPEPKPAAPEQPSGSVNARSSKGDLVEYGVANGGDRAELDAMTREQLLDRYVRKPE